MIRVERKKRNILIVCLALVLPLVAAAPAVAKLGVGVNVGRIEVNEPLLSGGIYRIAKVGVINTGTEKATYEVDVSYLEDQKQLRPPKEWFSFKPKRLSLKPKDSEHVEVTVVLPVKAAPGKYFALIEAHPVIKKEAVTISIAAASKMSFTVESSSLFWSIINRVSSWLTANAPYTYIGLGILVLAIAVLIFRRFARISLRVERKGG